MEDDDVEVVEVDEQQDAAAGPSLREELEKGLSAAAEAPEKPAPVEAPAKATPASAPPADGQAAPAVAPPTEGDAPPGRLKARFTPESWAALPPEVKQTFHDYETQIGRLGNRFGRDAQSWKEVSQIIAPYQEMITSEGGTPLGAIQNLFETSRILRYGHPDQKSGMVFGMLDTFQIPHRKNEDGTITLLPPRSDPALLARLHNLEGGRLTDDAARMHNLNYEVEQDLESFRSDPARVYLRIEGFPDVMAQLISSGQAADLQTAYEQASWLHPESRKLEIAKQAKAQADTAAATTAAAKRAAVSVPGAPPGNVKPSTQGMSLRDELEARLRGDL